MIGCYFGAKILYIIFSVKHLWISELTFMQNFSRFSIIMIGGGLVFYGGLLGSMIGSYIYLKVFHLPVISYFGAVLPIVPLFHAFGRLGCYFTGCCHGVPYNGVFRVVYSNSPAAENHKGYFPVQLLEAGLNFLIFMLLSYITLKRPKWKEGSTIGLYLLCYCVMRFFLEFLRGDEIRGSFFALSSSQCISILLIPVALFLLHGKKSKNIRAI